MPAFPWFDVNNMYACDDNRQQRNWEQNGELSQVLVKS